MLEAIVFYICINGSAEACSSATDQWYQQWPYKAAIELQQKKIEKQYPEVIPIFTVASVIYHKEVLVRVNRFTQLRVRQDESVMILSIPW